MTSDSERTFDKVLNNDDPFARPLRKTPSQDPTLNPFARPLQIELSIRFSINHKQIILYDNPFQKRITHINAHKRSIGNTLSSTITIKFCFAGCKSKIIEGLINIYRIYLNYTHITVSHSILNISLISAYLFPLMFSFSYRKTITPALNPQWHPTEEGLPSIP